MRLFIAIELPPDVREHLVRLRESLRPFMNGASITRDDNLHITLKFLGESDARQMAKLNESLALIRTGGEIAINASAVECFPPRGPIRIVAAGFDGAGMNAIRALHQSVEQRCQQIGFTRETRAYRPHVTLARARPTLPASLRADLSRVGESLLPGPAMQARSLALVSSRLTPNGSEYTVEQRFPLSS